MDGDNNSFVRINNLTKRFGGFTALQGLTLEVGCGEIFALLGPNGAGKTTTIKLLMGMLAPSDGEAFAAGHHCFKEREQVMEFTGYQPDEPVFQDFLSGWDLIRFAGELRGMSAGKAVRRAKPLFQVLNLEGDLGEYAVNYSKGMRKKLATVLAFMHSPQLLILDEPTNGLDPYATRDLHELIRERARNGAAVFFCTHLLDQAQKLCNRVGIINKGKLAAQGELDALRKRGDETLEEIFFSVTETKDEADKGGPREEKQDDAPPA